MNLNPTQLKLKNRYNFFKPKFIQINIELDYIRGQREFSSSIFEYNYI